ncbi:hypothetical protein SAMN04488096_1331, partial [Mesonia phycicola]
MESVECAVLSLHYLQRFYITFSCVELMLKIVKRANFDAFASVSAGH